jgi:hypothetical protein
VRHGIRGILFPDRLEDPQAFGFSEELEASDSLQAMRRQLEQHAALADLGPLFGPQAQGREPHRGSCRLEDWLPFPQRI